MVCFDELEQPCKQSALKLETALVVSIGKNKEYILYDAEEILLKERIANGYFRYASKVIDYFQTYFPKKHE